MDFSFYSQAVPDLALSPSDCHVTVHNQYGRPSNIENEFKIADLPVKLELRYAIEAKRAEKGLDMPILDELPRLPRELTIEEEERRRLRRERNKVAASKCRVKRKCHVKKLLKESDELTKSNNQLIDEIEKLKFEKQRLEEAIHVHACNMPSPNHLYEDRRCHGS